MSERYNQVRDYNLVQGTYHPADLSGQIIRDINVRYATVENGGRRPIDVAITTYSFGPKPEPQFRLGGFEIKHLALNPQGGPDQFIHLFHPETGKPLGPVTILDRTSNQFVIRDGLNQAFVHKFSRPSYRPAK